MTSTFFGLETAKRGMNTQQNALYVTGQNISNANTPGYTRQRINFEATEPFPPASMNRPQIPGQMGTGVQAGSVQRVREAFLDQQYRGENSKLGYWSSKADALSKMEDILNEPSTSGLSTTLNQFWQSLQDLSADPENDGARAVVLQRAQAVAETFNYLSDSITSNQKDIGDQISVSVTDINSILKQIASLNDQISKVEPNGYLPNDLYDERDRLVDQLSSYMTVQVDRKSSGGNASPIADGIYTISIIGSDGNPINLVSGSSFKKIGFEGGADSDGDNLGDAPPTGGVTKLIIRDSDSITDGNDQTITFSTDGKIGLGKGKLSGLIESYGYVNYKADGTSETKGTYPDMLDQLDQLAYSFGMAFNEVHKQGYDLNGNNDPDLNFFIFNSMNSYGGAAQSIKFNSDVTKDKIAASGVDANGNPAAGNGQNAINLANVQKMNFANKGNISLEGGLGSINLSSLPYTSGTITSNYQGIIGKLGVDAQQAYRLEANTTTLLQSVDQNRQSVSAVSLDEEMINMIKFQQAYNASARNITIVDEMLDKIINGMGTGGR